MDPNTATIREVAGSLMTLDEGVKAMSDRIKGFLGTASGDVTVAKILEEVERLKATQTKIAEQINAATAKNGKFIEGGKKFSIARAMLAIRTGNWQGAEHEQKAIEEARTKATHSSDIGQSVGFMMPDDVSADLVGAIYARHPLINVPGTDGQTLVSVLDGVTSMTGKLPKFQGGAIAYWIGEEDQFIESQVKTADIDWSLRKLAALIRMNYEVRRFGNFVGLEALIRRDIIEALTRKLNWTMLYGNGSANMPRGVINAPGKTIYSAKLGAVIADDGSNIPNSAGNTGDEFNYDDAYNMMGVLEDNDFQMDGTERFVWATRVGRRMRQLKIENYSGQTSGMPYLTGMPIMSDARFAELLGAPFVKSTVIKSDLKPGASVGWATDSTEQKFSDVFFARWSDVVFVRGSAVEIEDDNGRGPGWLRDQSMMKVRMYGDVLFRHEKSIVVCPDARART